MDTMRLCDIVPIKIPKIEDRRGNLSVIEKECVPFAIKRVYYLYDVPSGSYRGGHSHKVQQEVLIAISGSFNLVVHDSIEKKTILLNQPDEGFLIPSGIWRELDNFSSGAICLVLASDVFEEADYIRDFNFFLASKGR